MRRDYSTQLAHDVSLLEKRYESLQTMFMTLVATISHEANADKTVAALRISMQPLFRNAILSAELHGINDLLITRQPDRSK